jgi:8-oxo-dGTP pyrophosphatase MutT (NUDIX family)
MILQKQLFTAGLVVIKQKKLLLAFSKSKQAWYLPGGKTDAHETAAEALIREVEEELNVRLKKKDLKFYMHIKAPAFGETAGIIMEQDCFLCELSEPIIPSAEIHAVKYFDNTSYSFEEKQVPGVVIILKKLKQDGFVD